MAARLEELAGDRGPHRLVLHNDPINGMDFVVRVLTSVLGCGMARATWLMLRAHVTGRATVFSGTRAEARERAEAIRAFGPDPAQAHRGARPLEVTVEPAPSG